MLILASANDRLQVITSVAGILDTHTSWVDTVTASASITPGRANNSITTAATTSIAGGAPPASTQRNVKSIHLRNKGGAPMDVTVQLTDGTVVSQLLKATLAIGQSLQYTDQGGFRLSSIGA